MVCPAIFRAKLERRVNVGSIREVVTIVTPKYPRDARYTWSTIFVAYAILEIRYIFINCCITKIVSVWASRSREPTSKVQNAEFWMTNWREFSGLQGWEVTLKSNLVHKLHYLCNWKFHSIPWRMGVLDNYFYPNDLRNWDTRKQLIFWYNITKDTNIWI